MRPSDRIGIAWGGSGLVAQAAALRLVLQAGLAALPFPLVVRMTRLLAGVVAALRGRAPTPRDPRTIAWAVRAAGRRLPLATSCLVEALAAKTLLDAERRPSRLRIGVCGGDGKPFQAHAWLECDGEVVAGAAGMGNFRPLMPLSLEGWL